MSASPDLFPFGLKIKEFGNLNPEQVTPKTTFHCLVRPGNFCSCSSLSVLTGTAEGKKRSAQQGK